MSRSTKLIEVPTAQRDEMHDMSTWKLAERERWQPVEPFLTKVGVGQGMIVAVVSAGDGYFAMPVAKVLKGSGTVFAVDSDESRIEALRQKLSRESLTGWVVPVLSSAGTFALPDGSVDMAVFVDVLHRTEEPEVLLRETVRVLRSQGSLIIVDWAPPPKGRPEPVLGPAPKTRLAPERVRELAAEAGFEQPEELDLYELHYTLSFRRPAVVGRRG